VIDPVTGAATLGPQTSPGALDYLGAYADLVGSRIRDAVTAPARTYRGEIGIFDPSTGHVSDEAMGAGAGIAGLAMTGSLPFKAPAGAIRSFGGMADKDALAALDALEAGLGDFLAKPAQSQKGEFIGHGNYTIPLHERRQPQTVDASAKSWDLYHGSEPGVDFQKFDPYFGPAHSERGAIFFAPDPATASTYAGTVLGETLPNGAEAGSRVFRTSIDPGKTAVFDLGHLVENDPVFNAQAREIITKEAGKNWGVLYDNYINQFQMDRAQNRATAEQVRAFGGQPEPPAGVTYAYGHIGAAIARAKEQGLDTAILRGLAEHGGDDQVVVLTPNRVRSHYAPDQLLYAGTPLGAGVGASLAAPGDSRPLPLLGALGTR
jgi:hypothetical protein